MEPPLACFTCCEPIDMMWPYYRRNIRHYRGKEHELLEKMGIVRDCCARMLVANQDISWTYVGLVTTETLMTLKAADAVKQVDAIRDKIHQWFPAYTPPTTPTASPPLPPAAAPTGEVPLVATISRAAPGPIPMPVIQQATRMYYAI